MNIMITQKHTKVDRKTQLIVCKAKEGILTCEGVTIIEGIDANMKGSILVSPDSISILSQDFLQRMFREHPSQDILD